MGRKSTKYTILNNKGTSEVFFVMVEKNRDITPSDIVDTLGIGYAGVREQIVRLESAGIVFMRKKEGRFRIFVVDWSAFCELVVDYLKRDSLLIHSTVCGTIKSENRPSKKEAESILSRLRKDIKFCSLVSEYFKELVRRKPYYETIKEAIDSFEDEIVTYSKDFRENDKTGRLLTKWKAFAAEHDREQKEVFKKALTEVAVNCDKDGR